MVGHTNEMKMHNEEWFRHALNVIHHPVALVDLGNRFVWVNGAFERLVGYASAELLGETWMSITIKEDVGGDLAAVESVIAGERNNYTTAKKYRHKSGEEVPIALTVWRFPQGSDEMIGFSVEAISLKDQSHKIDAIHQKHEREVKAIISRIEALESSGKFWAEAKKRFVRWWPLLAAIGAVIGWVVGLIVETML